MPSLASLAKLKAAVNITSTVDDAELLGKLEAARELVESYCGATAPREVTEVVPAGMGYPQLLEVAPALEIVSATSSAGSEIDVSTATVRRSGLVLGVSLAGATVVYRAGRDPIPWALTEACLVIAAHLWKTQRGPGRPGRADDETVIGIGYALPNRAVELMRPYLIPAKP